MKKLNDTFSNGHIEIKVNCYNDMGGSMSFFSIGDHVPTHKINNDFENIIQYGRNYNIFFIDQSGPINKSYIMLIRSEIFVEIKPSWDLEETDVNGYTCIDIYGNPLDVRTVQEYDEYYKESIYNKQERNRFLKLLKESLDEEDQSRKDYEKQHAQYKEERLINKVINRIKYLFK